MIAFFNSLAVKIGTTPDIAHYISLSATAFIVVVICYLSYILTKKYFLRLIFALIKKSKFKWSEFLFSDDFLNRLAHFAPALAFHALSVNFPEYQNFFQRLASVYMVFIGLTLLRPLSVAAEMIYKKSFRISRQRPITGYLELITIFLSIIGILIIISIIINRSPAQLLAGIGALTAVLLLIFRDTLLGFVAAMKVASADMIRIGDWIEMPKYGADGDVVEINLTAIKVQNWDKTITTIPTYLLVSDSFKNWRSMEQAGGRRIKRAIYIDMTSVKFLDGQLLGKLEKVHLLTDYIQQRRKEIEEYNQEHQVDTSLAINGRRMTNLGTFRAYLEAYLHEHPKIHNDMTFLIRHLPLGEQGLPIEVYVFSNDTRWANYEAIQADIFDHILAVLPEFDLKVFQNPTGSDFQTLRNDPAL